MDTASTEIYTLPLHASLPISTNPGPPVFTIRLWGTAPFQNVVLVKDGTVAFSTSGDRVLSFTYQDQAAQKGKTSYYYVRGTQTDGQIVWVSPMWVTIQ